jgi:glycosyltransferase involved in cell wall biosynthesis
MEQMRHGVRSTFVKAGRNGNRARPRILFVISSETGGTPQTNADLMQGLNKDFAPFLLVCNSRVVQLRDCSQDEPVLLEEVKLQSPIRVPEHTSLEYDRHVGSMLITHGIEIMHIRHLSWHSLNLPRLAKSLGIPVVLSFHDFYAVCPNTQLLDENAIHCQGRCTDTQGDCEAPLWGREEQPRLKHDWVFTWRKKMRQVFDSCDSFVTTCSSARNLLNSVYPQLEEKPFPVIPHGRDFANFLQPDWILETTQKVRLLFPGNLNRAKGLDLILKLKELDADDRLEVHLLGKVATAYQPRLNGIVFHGPYRREDFLNKMEVIRPHCIGLFSLWPETYSHTLTEAWAAGIPVVATPYGALKERLEQWGGGWILPSTQPQEVYETLLSRLQDEDEFAAKLEQVQQWQETWAKNYGISEMAHQYRCLYQKTIFI